MRNHAPIFFVRFSQALMLLLLSTFNITALAQSDSTRLSILATKMEKQLAIRPVEKVYIQLNKPSYAAGDTIWLKGYVTLGRRHVPSQLSGVLYVELIDKNGYIQKREKLSISAGSAVGYIDLSAKQAAGTYHLRAYTNWMRNYGMECFFNSPIEIKKPADNAVYVQSSFAISHKGADTIKARLQYTDAVGRVFNKKKVNWEFRTDSVAIIKGTGFADNSGVVELDLPNKPLPRLQLTTHIQLSAHDQADKAVAMQLQSQTADVQFFPESGYLVTGVRSRVGIKAIGMNGLGLRVGGIIKDDMGNAVAAFTTAHAGMGVFAIIPEKGKHYKAMITLADSGREEIALPEVQSEGFVLSVTHTDSSTIAVRVLANAQTLEKYKGKHFYITGQSAGALYYTAKMDMDGENYTADINTERFPTGILQFDLLTEDMEPLNERLTYVDNPTDQLRLSLQTDRKIYTAGQKMTLDMLAMQVDSDKAATGNFSVAVYSLDENGNNEDAAVTIKSQILLQSELRGYIEEPGYYFNPDHDKTERRQAMDNLLLTQGYRKFDWQLLNDSLAKYNYAVEHGITLAGTLTAGKNKAVAGGKINLLAINDGIAADLSTDEHGRFIFPNLQLTDSSKIVLRARKANDGTSVNILLDNDQTAQFIPRPSIGELSAVMLPEMTNTAAPNFTLKTVDTAFLTSKLSLQKQLNHSTRSKLLNDVTVKSKKIEKPDQSNLWGAVKPEKTITGDQMRDNAMTYNGLVAHVPGILINNGHIYDANPLVKLRAGDPLLTIDDFPIPIVLNGVPIRYDDDIDALVSTDQIEDVKIIRGNEFKPIYGIKASNPNDRIIVITTKAFAGTDTATYKGKKVPLNHNLKEVRITSRKNAGTEFAPWQVEVKRSANLNGPGHANYVIGKKDLITCVQLSDCLQTLIPGVVTIYGQEGIIGYKFPQHMARINSPFISYMIDGVFVGSNLGMVDAINPASILTIEVLKDGSYLSIYGQQASGGLVIITTGNGTEGMDEYAMKTAPGVLSYQVKGLQKVKQFYVPKYTPGTNITDERDAVYWNPNIVTAGDGRCVMEYYNSTLKGNYKVVVEGIDNNGRIGRDVYRYIVE